MVDSQALVQSLRNLETAFKRFFQGISKYSRYKSKYNPIQSYKILNINKGIRIKGNRIRLPKVGWIKFRTKQEIKGKIKSVTVRKNPSGNTHYQFYVKMFQVNYLNVIIVVVGWI